MSRVRKTVTGLLAVDFPVIDECAAPLDSRIDQGMLEIAGQSHEHFVKILNAVSALKTETVEQSVTKRIFLYYGQLMNDALGAVMLLTSHGQLTFTFHVVRSAYEYVLRAIYWSKHKSDAVDHLSEIWSKGERLFKDIDLSFNDVRDHIAQGVEKYNEEHPKVKRPSDVAIRAMLVDLFGERRATKLYARFHKFYSPLVHGFMDGIPFVIEYDGAGTRVKPLPNISNVMVCEVVRFAFTLLALYKREFTIVDEGTLPLFRAFVRQQRVIGHRVQPPFPRAK